MCAFNLEKTIHIFTTEQGQTDTKQKDGQGGGREEEEQEGGGGI